MAPHVSVPQPPKAIPKHALELTADPTRAWEVVGAVQPVTTLHLDEFVKPRKKPPGAVRFVVVSDTHSRQSRLTHKVPMGDVLLHCGDWSQTGDIEEIEAFAKWFGSFPHPRKIFIAGNHDLSMHPDSFARVGPRYGQIDRHKEISDAAREIINAIPNCEYLEDSGTEVGGLNVWGSPWQPEFCDWAFNLPRGEACRERWRLIPTDTDVLLTHGPPLGHGDLCSSGIRAGCLDLLDEVQSRVRPKVHCFGHIHEGFGATSDGQTTFLNASTCNLKYRPSNAPLCFDLPSKDFASSKRASNVKEGRKVAFSEATSLPTLE